MWEVRRFYGYWLQDKSVAYIELYAGGKRKQIF